MHFLLNRGLTLVVPPNLGKALTLAQAVVFGMFLLTYVYLAWDMLTVFMPQWKVNPRAKLTQGLPPAETENAP